MSVVQLYGGGCVMSDNRLAVFGGKDASDAKNISSCEARILDAHGAC
jgi:hypothetical protein